MPTINKDQFISIIQGASNFNITLPDGPAEFRITEPNPQRIDIAATKYVAPLRVTEPNPEGRFEIASETTDRKTVATRCPHCGHALTLSEAEVLSCGFVK